MATTSWLANLEIDGVEDLHLLASRDGKMLEDIPNLEERSGGHAGSRLG